MAVLLLAPFALAACSSGQISQTVMQSRDKTGTMASLGPIELRQVQLEYPREGVYEPGADAALMASIVNTGAEADTLVSITGDAFRSVYTTGTGTQATSTAAATTGAAGGSTPAPSGRLAIEVPPDSSVYLGKDTPHVYLSGLSESLTSGQSIQLTLTFQKAGTVTMTAHVAPAYSPLPHTSTYNFDEPEGSPSPGAGGHN